MCVCNMHMRVWSQPVSQFPFYTMWIPGIECRSLGLTQVLPAAEPWLCSMCHMEGPLLAIKDADCSEQKDQGDSPFVAYIPPSCVNKCTTLWPFLYSISKNFLSYVKIPYRNNLGDEGLVLFLLWECPVLHDWVVGQARQSSSPRSTQEAESTCASRLPLLHPVPSLWNSQVYLEQLSHT